jgi:hypothetical protein
MPYEINWYIPEKIIFVHLWGVHTLEETVQLSTDILERITTGNDEVHVVIDGRELEEVPNDLNAVLNSLNGMRHPKVGCVVNVGDHNIFIQFMMRAVTRIMSINYRLVKKLPQAFEFVKQNDTSIDWSQANQDVVNREIQV